MLKIAIWQRSTLDPLLSSLYVCGILSDTHIMYAVDSQM